MIVRIRIKRNIIIAVAAIVFFCLLIYSAGLSNSRALNTAGKDAEKNLVIIIDAGHGGPDGGASAEDGTPEKDLNLMIANNLNLLLKSTGLKTLMIRTGDYSVCDDSAKTIRQKKVSDIRNRLTTIEQTPNSVFVSIHQNHFSQEKYFGTQVFYSGNNEKSKQLAQSIQSSVVRLLQPDNARKVKKSGTDIYLLYHAKSPAVLVECGFLSNYAETAKLKNEKYRQKLAFSIMCGILDYIGAEKQQP